MKVVVGSKIKTNKLDLFISRWGNVVTLAHQKAGNHPFPLY